VRRELDLLFVEGAGRLTEHLLDSGDHAGVAEICERLLERDPLDEAACRRMLQAAVAGADARAALRAYEQHAATVRDELGEEPGAELASLAEDLRARLAEPP
jgi:DNA-binding SARP family transcriptional activator